MHQEIDVVNEQPQPIGELMEENNNDVVIEAPIQQLVNQDSNQELEDVQTEQ